MVQNDKMKVIYPEIIWTGISMSFSSSMILVILIETMPNLEENDQYKKSL